MPSDSPMQAGISASAAMNFRMRRAVPPPGDDAAGAAVCGFGGAAEPAAIDGILTVSTEAPMNLVIGSLRSTLERLDCRRCRYGFAEYHINARTHLFSFCRRGTCSSCRGCSAGVQALPFEC